jgi:hypothetical protein
MLSAACAKHQGQYIKSLLVEQFPAHGVTDKLRTIARLELGEQMFVMRPDGRRRDVQPTPDLRSAEPVGDQLEHLLLARAQQRALCGPPAADLAGDRRLGLLAQRRPPASHPAHRGPEGVGRDAAREDAGRPVADQLPGQRIGRVVQQHDARGQPLACDRGEHATAVEARELAGDERDVRQVRADRGQYGATVDRLGQKLQPRVLADHAGERVAKQRLRIGDDHDDHAANATRRASECSLARGADRRAGATACFAAHTDPTADRSELGWAPFEPSDAPVSRPIRRTDLCLASSPPQ